MVRDWALSFPETTEFPHFGIVSFKVKGKVFATLNAAHQRATLKFSRELQDIFIRCTQGAMAPVPNKWGASGWTHVFLEIAVEELVMDALLLAWRETAPITFAKKYPELFTEPE